MLSPLHERQLPEFETYMIMIIIIVMGLIEKKIFGLEIA